MVIIKFIFREDLNCCSENCVTAEVIIVFLYDVKWRNMYNRLWEEESRHKGTFDFNGQGSVHC